MLYLCETEHTQLLNTLHQPTHAEHQLWALLGRMPYYLPTPTTLLLTCSCRVQTGRRRLWPCCSQDWTQTAALAGGSCTSRRRHAARQPGRRSMRVEAQIRDQRNTSAVVQRGAWPPYRGVAAACKEADSLSLFKHDLGGCPAAFELTTATHILAEGGVDKGGGVGGFDGKAGATVGHNILLNDGVLQAVQKTCVAVTICRRRTAGGTGTSSPGGAAAAPPNCSTAGMSRKPLASCSLLTFTETIVGTEMATSFWSSGMIITCRRKEHVRLRHKQC